MLDSVDERTRLIYAKAQRMRYEGDWTLCFEFLKLD